jgi:hypothetical protein
MSPRSLALAALALLVALTGCSGVAAGTAGQIAWFVHAGRLHASRIA